MGSPEALQAYSNKEILNRTQFIGWPRSIDIKKTWYGNNGFQIGARPETPSKARRKVVPGRTARHEAKHAVPDPDNVETVTIIPGPGYNGLTKLRSPDPIAALAPDATGEDGTGYDVFIASLMTNDISSAANVAKSIINKSAEEVEEVASVLEEKKTITGHEVKQAIASVRNKRENGKKATVFIKSPEGFEQRIPDVDVKNGIVMLPTEKIIPSKHYEIPKEGIIFSRN